jgi:hypothetical protein
MHIGETCWRSVRVLACVAASFGAVLMLGRLARQTIEPVSEAVPTKPTPAPPPANQKARRPAPPPEPDPASSRSIRIAYRDLVDTNQLTQSGRSLGDTIAQLARSSQQHLRGQVQPFLDRFSELLPQTLDAVEGVGEWPRSSLADAFPPGSPQPAWAALVRSGRFVVTDDGDACASVFVPGDDPKTAYVTSYSVVRHALRTLLPPGSLSLKVRVYAYTNDYAACELRLWLDPFIVEAREFPPPEPRIPLDLNSLKKFFAQCAELTGGIIDARDELVLAGKQGNPPTLVLTNPVTLADLAVAYRAVFHAGDNQAFVSLDPHRDPTRVTVNFGGFLEDTHIGWTVLEADKRFKTISAGLDPTSLVDVRRWIRTSMPTFATISEREICMIDGKRSDWEETRFWYYPDSVEIQSSPALQQCAIAKAQFTADAERSRGDFRSEDQFREHRKTKLSPAVSTNIHHLNANYDSYGKLFQELQELASVARLMGVCVWLKKANAVRTDLDELLAVELPAFATPREKEQLVYAATATTSEGVSLKDLAEVAAQSSVSNLAPDLTNTLSEVFKTDEMLARYLEMASGAGAMPREDRKPSERWLGEAQRYRKLYGSYKIADLMLNENSLRAFTVVRGTAVEPPARPDLAEAEDSLRKVEAQLKWLTSLRDEMSERMQRSPAVEKLNQTDYDELERQIPLVEAERDRQQEALAAKQEGISRRYYYGIAGGISLIPREFRLLRVPAGTPLLGLVRQVATMAVTVSNFTGVTWVRSANNGTRSIQQNWQLSRSWALENRSLSGEVVLSSLSTKGGWQYWRAAWETSLDWRDQTVRGKTATRRHYDSAKQTLTLTTFEDGKPRECVRGQSDGQRLMRFQRYLQEDNVALQSPPPWWQNEL